MTSTGQTPGRPRRATERKCLSAIPEYEAVSAERRSSMNEVANPLPKTRAASLCQQWIRCGKPSCRCARGELHGPYHYVFWREGGRLKKQYVRQRDVEAIRAEIAERRQWLWLEREARKLSRAIWREQLDDLREYERWLRKP